MANSLFLKTSAMAALVAGLALGAVPAEAQPDGTRDRGGRETSSQSGGGGNGGNGWQARQQVQQSEPQPQPQAQPAPQVRQAPQQRDYARRGDGNRQGDSAGNYARNRPGAGAVTGGTPAWNGNRGSDGADRGGWQQRQAQGQAQSQAQAQARARAGDRQGAEARREGGWNGRNRSYVDPNRNGGYRDGSRSDQLRDRRGDNDRNNSWRNNDRRNDNWRDGRRNDNGSRYSNNNGWSQGWRQDRRYDWQGYRNQNRSHYQIGRYYSPYRNYSYRRLSIGFSLDSLFFGSSYWINDPYSYRLPAVDGSYRWVRYYDDVLLVDTYSGEVVDVIYDFFW